MNFHGFIAHSILAMNNASTAFETCLLWVPGWWCRQSLPPGWWHCKELLPIFPKPGSTIHFAFLHPGQPSLKRLSPTQMLERGHSARPCHDSSKNWYKKERLLFSHQKHPYSPSTQIRLWIFSSFKIILLWPRHYTSQYSDLTEEKGGNKGSTQTSQRNFLPMKISAWANQLNKTSHMLLLTDQVFSADSSGKSESVN